MKQFLINEQLLTAVFQFLAEQPYKEVHQLIKQLEQNVKVHKPEEETK